MTPPPTKPPWTWHLAKWLACSESFLRELDAQLAPAFAEKTGLALADFALGPEGPEKYVARYHGLVGSLDATLTGNGLGFPVTLAWADPAQKRAVATTDEVTASDIRFWWHELPATEIVEEERRWPAAPFEADRFSFAVDFQLKRWPHVRLTLELREAASDPVVTTITELVATAMSDWEAAPDRQGGFHEVGVVEIRSERTVAVDVDLGSAGPAGLTFLLERLDASGLVAAVTVRAADDRQR